jgi:hypothetical protein
MRIKKLATGALATMMLGAAALAFGSPGTAHAEHEHWLLTPGTCVQDLGSGQTSIDDPGHGGYHRFHLNVHLGVPGLEAFANSSNPVSVGKGICP